MNTFTLSEDTEKCRKRLDSILSGYDRVAIAYSGGLDSTLLLESASRIKDADFTAIMVRNSFMTEDEINTSIQFLYSRNIENVIINADLLSEKKIAENSMERCYYCKKQIFEKIINTAESSGITVILDGTHHDDLNDYRPGLRALSELGIKSPLKESGFNKEAVRELARFYGLSNWESHPSPCLATRIPYGTEIRAEDLHLVEKGEKILKNSGFSMSRLRIHGNIARIEVPEEQLHLLEDIHLRNKIINLIKPLGFDYITIDLEGYRTGSMNININKDKNIGY
ncbi:MAG TPA: ATP-dependent sacrificial sulfur transferase LarE [Spirochaetota bacterium]|nr:ATP-dependent sacrificial sulfur transferase LarE [Spirochaetota bacterium]HPJ33347.1 ATP-dependent sacrificial sulfur transferase LarE [Spirochaetota bacterium]